jgi:hypothetical protein
MTMKGGTLLRAEAIESRFAASSERVGGRAKGKWNLDHRVGPVVWVIYPMFSTWPGAGMVDRDITVR